MERRSQESRLHTIRGKIWLMVILLAVTNCVSSSIAFVAASLLTSENWIPVLAAISVSTLSTIAFAWWISNDVLRPLDRLNLLAKSIERSPGMSVPRTTGAVETDDLLHTISRASRQLTNFIDLMDDVTAGNTTAVLDPLEHSDRLSESFRKLVAKVTDSIDAKAELERFQLAVGHISSELAGLQRGEFVRVRNDFEGTKAVTDALRFLIDSHSALAQTAGSNASEMKTIINEARNRLAMAVETDESRYRLVAGLSTGISEYSAEAERVLKELRDSTASITVLVEALRQNPVNAETTEKTQSALKKQLDAAINKLRDVGEQSLAITHVSKSVQDLAKRSKMIALNSSIQTSGETDRGLDNLAQEIASLSERAEKANKAISGISDSVVRDVNEASASLQWVASEISKLLARMRGSEDSLELVGQTLNQLSGLPERISSEASSLASMSERNRTLFNECLSRTGEISANLKSCETAFGMLNEPVDALRDAAVPRKQRLSPIVTATEANGNGNAKPKDQVRELITVAEEK